MAALVRGRMSSTAAGFLRLRGGGCSWSRPAASKPFSSLPAEGMPPLPQQQQTPTRSRLETLDDPNDQKSGEEIETAAALSTVESATTAFVIDAGSLHSQVFQFRDVGGRTQQAGMPYRLHGDSTSLSLGRDVLATENFTIFFDALDRHLSTVRSLAQPLKMFIGATNGVRKNIERGEVSQSTIDKFSIAIRGRFGADATFEVLTGEQEAALEYAAATHVFGPLFAEAGKDSVKMLAGGGSSVQIVASPGHSVSLTLETKAWEGRARDAFSANGHPDLMLAEARAQFEAVVDGAAAELAPLVAEGAFVGMAMFGDLSELGYAGRWLSKASLQEALTKLIRELREGLVDGKESACWTAAQAKWKERLRNPPERALWAIGMVGLLRLLVLIQAFGEPCEFYFAPSSSLSELQPDWPLGYHRTGRLP